MVPYLQDVRMAKVLVAMSGGVDSSVAALVLKRAGFSVNGVYMKTWMNELPGLIGECPWTQDIEDARAAAQAIGMEFAVVNFIRDYREKVVHYLVDGYRRGITPNPDVMCNREMKFGVLLRYAWAQGFDLVATGHYARLRNVDGQAMELLEGTDKNKDQSYFLAMLKAEQLERVVFPLGALCKDEVRDLARRAGLPNADKKDSQGICFLGKVKIAEFLAEYIPDHPGDIVDPQGRVLGSHRGLHRYTIGQRRGIGVPSNTEGAAYVVVARDAVANRLVVAFDQPESPGLYTREAHLANLSFIGDPIASERPLLAKPRFRDPSAEAVFTPGIGGGAMLRFQTEQRALAPGQVCALYEGDRLLGGGVYL